MYLTIWDLILTPVYLLILIAIAKKQRDKWYPIGHALRKYYLPALYVKFAGAIFIALIYQFYYGGGDTYYYFHHTRIVNSALSNDISIWLKLIFRSSAQEHPEIYRYSSQLPWYVDPSAYTVVAISAVFGVFTGTSYMPIAMLFAYFSFTGIWAMYRTFCNIYPKLHKELAIAFLFIPSTVVWGSAIFKDTICMFGLGWLTYTTFRMFINKDFSLKNILLFGLSFFLISKIKIYILLGFMPALAIWLLTTYSAQIKSVSLRFFVKLTFIGVAALAFMFIAQAFAQELNRYSLENIAKTAETTRNWIGYVSESQEGSGYDLGEFDPSIGGMLKKFPQAVAVTLFRPFPWEAKKVIVLLSALEALVFSFFTLKAVYHNGISRTLKKVGQDPNLLFFFVFSIIFAFAVGISSYNFGTLSRYKIPCLPFYAALLVVLIYKDRYQKETAGKGDYKRLQKAI